MPICDFYRTTRRLLLIFSPTGNTTPYTPRISANWMSLAMLNKNLRFIYIYLWNRCNRQNIILICNLSCSTCAMMEVLSKWNTLYPINAYKYFEELFTIFIFFTEVVIIILQVSFFFFITFQTKYDCKWRMFHNSFEN